MAEVTLRRLFEENAPTFIIAGTCSVFVPVIAYFFDSHLPYEKKNIDSLSLLAVAVFFMGFDQLFLEGMLDNNIKYIATTDRAHGAAIFTPREGKQRTGAGHVAFSITIISMLVISLASVYASLGTLPEKPMMRITLQFAGMVLTGMLLATVVPQKVYLHQRAKLMKAR